MPQSVKEECMKRDTERKQIEALILKYEKTVYKLAYSYMKNKQDTDDIYQEVFLRFFRKKPEFESEEHEKAWFIRVTINACKDLLKNFFRTHTVALEEVMEQPALMPPDHREVLEAVLSLPAKYKEVVYLHYYEDYTVPEISGILGKNVNTIYTLLTRSRKMLREKLGGDGYEGQA